MAACLRFGFTQRRSAGSKISARRECICRFRIRGTLRSRRLCSKTRVSVDARQMAPSFKQYDISPDSVEFAQPLASSDFAKAAPLVNRNTGHVLGEDPGLQSPDAILLGLFD